MPSLTFDLPDAAATARLGAALAPLLRGGDALMLSGDLGAGKSALARAIIQARQTAAGALAEDVPSPTYTLVQTYPAGDVEIWHCDLYRLGDAGEVAELGLDDLPPHAVLLVEWPERMAPRADAVTAHLWPEGDGRRIRFDAAPETPLLDRIATLLADG